MQADLSAKRLELLKEAVPSVTRIAILANPNNYGTQAYLEKSRAWAQAARVTLLVHEVRDPTDVAPTEADAAALHVRSADRAVRIENYLDPKEIVRAAAENGAAQAIHAASGACSRLALPSFSSTTPADPANHTASPSACTSNAPARRPAQKPHLSGDRRRSC